MEEKRCRDCGCTKLLEKFPKHPETRDGRGSYCKKCMGVRRKDWKRRNPEKVRASKIRFQHKNPDKLREYQKRYSDGSGRFKKCLNYSAQAAIKQGHLPCSATSDEIEFVFTGRCHVCGALEGKRKLCMDHSHQSGCFRGWLCGECNRALGCVGDSVDILLALAEYLEDRCPDA